MKRILQLCLFLFLTFLTNKELSAQGTYTITCNPMCYSLPSNTYAAQAAYIGGAAASAVNFSWSIAAPPGSSATITPVLGAPPLTNSVANITASGCGAYTVTCISYDANGANVGQLQFPNFPGFTCAANLIMPNNIWYVACPNSGTYSIGNSTVCSSATTAISALVPAATSFSWSNNTFSTGPTSTINVSPQVNTCYSYTAELVTGGQTCAITPTSPVCLSIQGVNATLSPASQTMCAGSPVTFTALTTTTGTNNTAGTTVTSYSWSSPAPQSFTTATNSTSMPAANGVYTVYITHTGAAGNCVTTATANVTIGTSVSMSITPSSPSVCPNSSVTLTAITSPTTGNSFTWTAKSSTGAAIASGTGNPKTFTTGGVGNFPWSYTVDVNYGGCPGTAIFTLGILQLTPTITPSSYSVCPGTAVTLTAHGAVNYTFSGTDQFGIALVPNPIGVPPSSVVVHTTPSTPSLFPLKYTVNADSAGCIGTGTVAIHKRDLFPKLSLSQTTVVASGSVCPGTQFTLSSHSVGNATLTPTTYTFLSFFGGTVIGTAGQTNSFVPYNPATPNPSSYPQTYTVLVDSSGCKGTATATVNILTMHPQLVASSPSVCPGTSVSITSTNTGAGTTYSFYANDFTASTPPLNYTLFTGPTTNNFGEHWPTFPTGTVPVTYSVHVDSAGCVGDATINVGRQDLANTFSLVSSPANNLICPTTTQYNNTFSLMVTGTSLYGSPSFTYAGPTLSNIIYTGSSTITQVPSPSTIGGGVTYSVLAKDSTCVGLITLTMHELKLHPTISVTPTLVCAGMPVTVTAGGVAGGVGNLPNVNYQFYQSVPPANYTAISPPPSVSVSVTHSPTSITNYSVSVDSMGCTGVIPGPTTSVAIRPTLSLTPSASQLSVCPGLTSTLNVTGPVGNTSLLYTWMAPTGASITTTASSPTAVAYPTVPTTYSVHAIDSLGCVGDTVITIGMDPSLSFTMGLANSGSSLCVGQSATLSAGTGVETLGGP
ncbi:MAG: hypothetical protein JNL60_17460, partial [Bacteroidia bacterium]|nr:hypothetical protein [Bacteroidia bacterium]